MSAFTCLAPLAASAVGYNVSRNLDFWGLEQDASARPTTAIESATSVCRDDARPRNHDFRTTYELNGATGPTSTGVTALTAPRAKA